MARVEVPTTSKKVFLTERSRAFAILPAMRKRQKKADDEKAKKADAQSSP